MGIPEVSHFFDALVHQKYTLFIQANYPTEEAHTAPVIDAQPRFTDQSLIETVEFPASAITHADTNEAIIGQPNYETLTISVNFVDGNHADADDISNSEAHYIYQNQAISQSISQEVRID